MTGMRGHVDAEDLALGQEGLLGRRQAARIRAHLARCASCARVNAELAELPALLARMPVPPMPAHVATLIDAALSAEAGRPALPDAAAAGTDDAAPDTARSPAASPATPPSTRPSTPRARSTRPGSAGPPGRPRRRPVLRSPVTARILAGAAVAVVLGGGGYAVAQLGASSGSNSTSSAGSAGAGAGAGAPAASPAFRAPAGAVRNGTGLSLISSGTNYLPRHLAAQAAAVLAGHQRPDTGSTVPVPSTGQEPFRSTVLRACVARIAGDLPPRLVDQAQYQGKPATIIITAAAGKPAQVWVVGPGCSGSDSDLLNHAPLSGAG